MVLGGGRLVQTDLEPVLSPDEFAGRDGRRGGLITTEVRERRYGNRVRMSGNSAEAIRAIKTAIGVPLRPDRRP